MRCEQCVKYDEEYNQCEIAFKVGDVVMRMDGDRRPHKIVDITVHYPLNRNEHTFFMYHYDDDGSDVSDWSYLRLYDGKYKK